MEDQQAPNEPHMVQMGTLYVKNKPYKIYEGLNVIGRNTTAAVNIKDIQISKNHAMIAVINANQHFIADFNSANGTKLTSNHLIPLKLYPLDDNVTVQFAEISALYRIDCEEGDGSSNNTQTSQLTQDLYLKSTQLLVQKNDRHVRFDNEKDSDSTTVNADDENTCDASDDVDISNFHDATTQVMSNVALSEDEEEKVTFSKFEDNFHEAETQVLTTVIASSLSKVTDSEPTDTDSPSKSEISKCNEQVSGRIHSPENPETLSHKAVNNVPTMETDSEESMIFEIRPEDRKYYANIIKRKKSNVLNSDDEDDAEPDKQHVTSSSYDDIQTPVFIQQKNARKVDSDCETYYDGSNHSSAGCEDVDNETNIIPSTQEDLSEVFNYKPFSPKPGPSNNHTFESSEDSFRLGLTQLMNKADLSESCTNNKNSTLKNTTLNEFTTTDHSFTGNVTSPTEENLKPNENNMEIGNDNNLEMETQNITTINDIKEDVQLVDTECKNDDIYAQPTQKFTTLNKSSRSGKIIQNPSGEAQMLQDDDVKNKLPEISADTEAEIYVTNTQCINEKGHEIIDNIYVLPTQKLVISDKHSQILADSIDESEIPSKTPTNDDANKLCSVDSECDIIENTECMDKRRSVDINDIYAQPTQKFHMSKVKVLSKTSSEPGKYNNENNEVTKTQEGKENKLNSIFDAETQMLPQNVPISKNTSGKTIHIDINDKPGVSFENIKEEDVNKDTPVGKKSPRSEQKDYNHIYSMETQVITYPKPLNGPKAKDIAAINLETQTEVSFSQENVEPTRVLDERPANPLVAVLKSDTQEDGELADNCNNIETEINNKTIDDPEISKEMSETVNDHSVKKKSKHHSESSKIKLVESENCIPLQVESKCDDSSNVTKEDSKTERKAKRTKSQSTSNESDIELAKTHTVTPRKTRHAYLSSSSESGKMCGVTTDNITRETLVQPKSKNDFKETIKLPKKRGILNSVAEENVEDNAGEASVIAKRSKRKLLGNVDEVEQEPVATSVTASSEETSQLARKKSTRSSRSSNCNEVKLISKPTKRNSRMALSDLKADRSSQNSSSDEFEKPSDASTNSTLKQDKMESKCDSKSSTREEKVIKSKKSSGRTKKTLDVLNENEDDKAGETSDNDKKQKPGLEKLLGTEPSSRTTSPASTSSEFSLPEAQVLTTRKRSQRLPNAKSPTRSSKPLAADIGSTSEVQATPRRKRKQEVSRSEAPFTSSTPIVEDADIPQIQTPIRKGRQKLSNTGSLSTNSPALTKNRLSNIPEAHLPSKKRRGNVVDIENSSTSSTENIRSSSASSSGMNTPERKKRTLKPKVVFTMMDSPLLESTIKHLGGSVVDSVAACTVLVTEKIKRTMKLLTAIGFAKPICSPKWIEESKKSRQFLDPWDFILKDPEAEGKWNFSLSDSLQKSTNTKLMDGLNFHILATDNIADVLKSAIEACGGKCLHRITKADASKNIFIVTPQECKSKCLKLKKQHQNTTAIDPEGIFESVLRQELRLENHIIDV